MRKILLIARREYLTSVKTKAFFIMIVLMPIMMGGGLIAYTLFKNQKDTADKRIAVVDRSGRLAEGLVAAAEERNRQMVHDPKTGKKVEPAYVIQIVPPDDADPVAQRVELSRQVKQRRLAAFVEIGRGAVQPGTDPDAARIRYHSENAAIDDARDWLAHPLNGMIREQRLADAGVEPEARQNLLNWSDVEALGLVTLDAKTGQVKDAERSDEVRVLLIPAMLAMLMFMMIMVGATPMLNVVMEEKMQRIAEVLLGSVKPFQLMLGKLLGTLGVSFTVIAIYMGGGIAAAYYMNAGSYIPFHALPWFFGYMVAAIVLFGSLIIALGAACNDAKEAQSMLMPVWLLVMIPMFVWMPVLKEPLSSFATGLSLVPPFTPILMMLRQSTPAGVPLWQPCVGLLGSLAFALACVWAGGRIFRVGILMQGNPPKPRDLIRWAIRG